jgi:hypothetical protein
MPIFQDPDQRCKQNTWNPGSVTHRAKEGRAMRCPPEKDHGTENGGRKTEDQKMEDVERVESLLRNITNVQVARMETSDRIELIERIKRGESPTWVPGRAVS